MVAGGWPCAIRIAATTKASTLRNRFHRRALRSLDSRIDRDNPVRHYSQVWFHNVRPRPAEKEDFAGPGDEGGVHPTCIAPITSRAWAATIRSWLAPTFNSLATLRLDDSLTALMTRLFDVGDILNDVVPARGNAAELAETGRRQVSEQKRYSVLSNSVVR